jgi:hypothetical protein
MSLVALAQGVYFSLTGVWPLVHLRSFLAVTGPKVDLWLVKTVGAIVAVVGLALLLAARSGRVTPEVVLLGVGSAVALAAVDVVYVTKRVIPKIYLLDAVGEVVLILAWGVAWWLR